MKNLKYLFVLLCFVEGLAQYGTYQPHNGRGLSPASPTSQSYFGQYNPNRMQMMGEAASSQQSLSFFEQYMPSSGSRMAANNKRLADDVKAYEQRRLNQHKMIMNGSDLDGRNRRLFEARAYSRYTKSWNAIVQMISSGELSLKESVYQTESFLNPDYLSYQDYNSFINEAKTVIHKAMEQEGYQLDNETAQKYMLHKYMFGVIELEKEGGGVERTVPMTYDFDDPMGYENLHNQFVLKLIKSHTGQCRSLPLFYLIMAEELGFEAYLSYSPNHSYVKLQDENGKWFNLEATNGHYTTDQWVMESGYVSAESIRQGVYLKKLNTKEILYRNLADILHYYTKGVGFDSRLHTVAKSMTKLDPLNVMGWITLSDYITKNINFVANQNKVTSMEDAKKFPDLVALIDYRDDVYAVIDKLGYSSMSIEQYKEWLTSHNEINQDQILKP